VQPRLLRVPRLARLFAGLLALAWLAPSGSACESCRQARAADGGDFAAGLNASILFMLSMVALIPTGFALVLWHSYRSDARRARDGGAAFQPAGKLRWNG
jgi:hypothetical protein